MRTSALIAITLAMAGALAAQTAAQPSAPKESFTIEPGTLKSGAANAAIRLISNTAAGFSNSSSKAPQVKFSAGAALVPGSFLIMNQNEAECRVNVEKDAFGTIAVSVELYAVNGTTVLKTLRGTLGIGGPQPVEGTQAQIAVEGIRLVRVNVPEPQLAGIIVLSGRISGSVKISAPTGTTFAQAPRVETSAGEIASARLEDSSSVFSFNIGNADSSELTARVTDARYVTSTFTASGGVAGDLACEVTGGALSNHSALVVNAFTAKTTIDGSNDVVNTPSKSGSTSSNSTNTGSSTSEPRPASTGVNTRRQENTRERRREQTNRTPPRPSLSSPVQQLDRAAQQPMRQQVAAPTVQGQPAPAAPQGAPPQPVVQQARPAAGPSDPPATGSAGPGTAPSGNSEDRTPGSLPQGKAELVVTPGLHFCDREFNPISALVLDRIVSGEAGGRVWILLRLAKDRNPEKVDTVTVRMTVAGTTRELNLTETGRNTGEFRCSREGVLLLAEENPDSNEPEAARTERKPRYSSR